MGIISLLNRDSENHIILKEKKLECHPLNSEGRHKLMIKSNRPYGLKFSAFRGLRKKNISRSPEL